MIHAGPEPGLAGSGLIRRAEIGCRQGFDGQLAAREARGNVNAHTDKMTANASLCGQLSTRGALQAKLMNLLENEQVEAPSAMPQSSHSSRSNQTGLRFCFSRVCCVANGRPAIETTVTNARVLRTR